MVSRILVVGNATVDETYVVPSLPCSGESLHGQFRLRDVGGKGANVASVLARCGVLTQLTTAIGDDERGEFARAALARESMTLDVQVLPKQPTDVSIVYVDPLGHNMIVTTTAAACSLECSRAEMAVQNLNRGDMLIMQGNLTQSLTARIAQLAAQRGVIFVFNPSPYAPWMKDLVDMADFVFLNAEEAVALTGLSGELAVLALLECGVGQVVLSQGERGVLMADSKLQQKASISSVASIPAAATSVVDSTGAGDTLLAVAVASFSLRGGALDAVALEHAVQAAAITISRHGAHRAFPGAAQLSALLSG